MGVTIAHSAKLETRIDYLRESLVRQLRSYVLTERLVETEQTLYFDHPATWWQHLKADLGWSWLLRRRPVRLGRHEQVARFERGAAYPKANVALPNLGSPVIFETFTFSKEVTA